MAVRDDWAAGEVLTADDLNQTFAEKVPYSYGTATPSTTTQGFLWYDSNSTPAAPKFWDGAAFQALTSGKILQVVRDTDTTGRTTTSTSFVDITGVSVTISPKKSDSALLLILTGYGYTSASNIYGQVRITDNSGNLVDGGITQFGSFSGGAMDTGIFIMGYATPATTSAVTYKGQFRTTAGTLTLGNTFATMQLFAIEVSA